MSNEPSNQEPPIVPPMSVFAGPIGELVGHRLLSPPNRPGLLATLARYDVLRVIGSGGMGVVLLARDSESGRDVALKMMRPELVTNQQAVHRFVKEAGHLQKLKHPGVVPILEVSDRPQGPYFVMPFFDKGSLAQRIKPGQGLEASTILDIAIPVAEGLQFAHRRGIIHRDLKPANILLGENGKTCLADFGLARSMFNDSIIDVEREQFEGTAPYMSPGVAAGNAEDTRCDIYAFGALLYEMLTGEPPYVGRSTQEIRKQILAGPPRSIRHRNPAADACLTIVAEAAMARELRDRYADMSDVLADLERIKLGRKPVGPHDLSRRVRHNPVAVWLAAGGALLVLWWMLHGTSQKKVVPPVASSSNQVPAPSIAQPAPTPKPAPPVVVAEGPKPTSAPPVVVQPTPVVPTPAPKPVSVPQTSPPIVVGSFGVSGSADGLGDQARFNSPGAIAVDDSGNVYVADTGNNTIRKISPVGYVTTLAGKAGQPGEMDREGSEARFTAPSGIAVDSKGNVYVAEFASGTIRKITPDGFVSLLAGSVGSAGWADANGDNAHFRNPWSVAVDHSGSVFVADKDNFVIRKITPDGRVRTMAGLHGQPGYSVGQGQLARFKDPRSVAVDLSDNVYVADMGNQAIWKISPSNYVSTVEIHLSNPTCVAVDPSGIIYFTDNEGIHKLSGGLGTVIPPLELAHGGPLAHADGIAVDNRGTLYIVDTADNVVCWKPK